MKVTLLSLSIFNDLINFFKFPTFKYSAFNEQEQNLGLAQTIKAVNVGC